MAGLTLTIDQLTNIVHGLDLLHSKTMDRLNSVSPLEGNGPDIKKYYREKLIEINEQMKVCRNLLR